MEEQTEDLDEMNLIECSDSGVANLSAGNYFYNLKPEDIDQDERKTMVTYSFSKSSIQDESSEVESEPCWASNNNNLIESAKANSTATASKLQHRTGKTNTTGDKKMETTKQITSYKDLKRRQEECLGQHKRIGLTQPTTTVKPKAKRIDPRAQMLERYRTLKNGEGRPLTPRAASSSSVITSGRREIDLNNPHRRNVATTATAAASVIIPRTVANCKLPLSSRIFYVKKIADELRKQTPSDECPVDQAIEIEFEICTKAKNFQTIYKSLLTSKIRSLRSTSATVSGGGSKFEPNNESSPSGIVYQSANCSIIRRTKADYSQLSRFEMLSLLAKLEVPETKLEDLGFPTLILETNLVRFPSLDIESKSLLDYEDGMEITCCRCKQQYVNPQKLAKNEAGCRYHPGRIFKYSNRFGYEPQYSCCKGDSSSNPCCTSTYHVTDGFHFSQSRKGFVSTFEPKRQQTPAVFALDCEMCYTTIGFELIRVTVLDFEGQIVYEELVKPTGIVLDYNTEYSGIKAEDLANVSLTLADVQRVLLGKITAGSIVIGHGLDSDFKALKLIHKHVIDTTYLFPHKQGLPMKRSLKNLASAYLNKIIQNNVTGGHDSNEDAKAALELVKLKLQDEINKFHNQSTA